MKEGLRVAQEIGWGEKLEPDFGIGVSCALKDGRGNYKISEARIEIDAHGKATLLEGTVEIGQGSHTACEKSPPKNLPYRSASFSLNLGSPVPALLTTEGCR